MGALPLPTEEAKHYNIVNFKDPPADIFFMDMPHSPEH
jgi:hypothetical protein